MAQIVWMGKPKQELTLQEQLQFARGQFNAISDLYEFYNNSKYNLHLKRLMSEYSAKCEALKREILTTKTK